MLFVYRKSQSVQEATGGGVHVPGASAINQDVVLYYITGRNTPQLHARSSDEGLGRQFFQCKVILMRPRLDPGS